MGSPFQRAAMGAGRDPRTGDAMPRFDFQFSVFDFLGSRSHTGDSRTRV
jgi:hypothetical protein